MADGRNKILLLAYQRDLLSSKAIEREKPAEQYSGKDDAGPEQHA